MADIKEFQIGSNVYQFKDEAARNSISALQAAVGSPLVANLAADMTDTTKVYVYTGSETGYTAGHWYYHNGSAWTDGGTYQSQGIGANSVTGAKISDTIRSTLMAFLQNVAMSTPNGQLLYQAVYNAFYDVAIEYIAVVFDQGNNVIYDTDSLDDLKQYLTVTAHFEDDSELIVSNYTLSGTLTEGTNTITVAYGGKTTTFNVTVLEYPYRTLVASDVVSHVGYTSYALNNGSITASAVTTFSVLALASAVTAFKFTPNKVYAHTEDHYITVIFASDGNGNYYGTDGSDIYKFTLASSKYNAAIDSEFSTLTKTGVLNDDTPKTITLNNGVLTLTGGNGSITLTNANMIGLWGSKPNYMLPLNAEVNK